MFLKTLLIIKLLAQINIFKKNIYVIILAAITHGMSKGINLSIVAMALAGINTTNNALWLSKCKELHSKIDNPYLRATFAFLTCDCNYDEILVSYTPLIYHSCSTQAASLRCSHSH